MEEIRYYSRAFVNKAYGSGFHFVNDLVPLYYMASHLKTYTNLSKEAKQRLRWFDYYNKCRNISLTCRYFGISRKTFHKWRKLYDPQNLFTLEDKSRAPKKKRQRQIAPEQELRITALRKKYIRYGKIKLAKIYQRECGEEISSWQIQKVIEKRKLYYHPVKTQRIQRKRLSALKKRSGLPN